MPELAASTTTYAGLRVKLNLDQVCSECDGNGRYGKTLLKSER